MVNPFKSIVDTADKTNESSILSAIEQVKKLHKALNEEIKAKIKALDKEFEEVKKEGLKSLDKQYELSERIKLQKLDIGILLQFANESEDTLNKYIQRINEEKELLKQQEIQKAKELYESFSDNNSAIANFLLLCCYKAWGKNMKAADDESESTASYSIGKIATLTDIDNTIDYLRDTYADKIKKDCNKGIAYYIKVDTYADVHAVYLLGVIYTLLVSGADIYVDVDLDADYYSSAFFRVFKLFYPYCNFIKSKDELKNYKDKFSHLVYLGDFCNSPFKRHEYLLTKNIILHTPGGVAILVDYESDTIPQTHQDKLSVFGKQAYNSFHSYDAYRSDSNNAKECYFGFDYGDLFWGATELVDYYKSLGVKIDRPPLLLCTDKESSKVELPCYANDYFNIIAIENLDTRYPLYNFLNLI